MEPQVFAGEKLNIIWSIPNGFNISDYKLEKPEGCWQSRLVLKRKCEASIVFDFDNRIETWVANLEGNEITANRELGMIGLESK